MAPATLCFEGFPLRLTNKIELGEDWFEGVLVRIPGDHVGLSFPLRGPDEGLPELKAEVVCVEDSSPAGEAFDDESSIEYAENVPFRIVSLESEHEASHGRGPGRAGARPPRAGRGR